MTIDWYVQSKGYTKYWISRHSGVPYSTLSDILRGKTPLNKCTAETVYRLAKTLGVSMEELLEPCMEERAEFELFKSNVCHKLNRLGDLPFLTDLLGSGEIRTTYERGWYPEAFYLLAMADYLCRIHGLPIAAEFEDIRSRVLESRLWPAGVLALCHASGTDDPKEQALKEAIPEFLHFNIVESEVRNVR